MYLFYAVGHGLGHLSRTDALIHTLNLSLDNCIIITNSKFAEIVFSAIEVIYLEDKDLREKDYVLDLLQYLTIKHKINNLYVDTFPCGIYGELCKLNLPTIKVILIARNLKLKEYFQTVKGTLPLFEKIFIVEKLHENLFWFIKNRFKNVFKLKIEYSARYFFNKHAAFFSDIIDYWLIVHSGNEEELRALYNYAKDVANFENSDFPFVIVSQVGKNIVRKKDFLLNYYPATNFFNDAKKIFTACGFNSMMQTEDFINKHYFIPFERKFDDQFFRANLRKEKLQKNKDQL